MCYAAPSIYKLRFRYARCDRGMRALGRYADRLEMRAARKKIPRKLEWGIDALVNTRGRRNTTEATCSTTDKEREGLQNTVPIFPPPVYKVARSPVSRTRENVPPRRWAQMMENGGETSKSDGVSLLATSGSQTSRRRRPAARFMWRPALK